MESLGTFYTPDIFAASNLPPLRSFCRRISTFSSFSDFLPPSAASQASAQAVARAIAQAIAQAMRRTVTVTVYTGTCYTERNIWFRTQDALSASASRSQTRTNEAENGAEIRKTVRNSNTEGP